VVEDREVGVRGEELINFAFKSYLFAMFPSAGGDEKEAERAAENSERWGLLIAQREVGVY
jgi:hypothetical protein